MNKFFGYLFWVLLMAVVIWWGGHHKESISSTNNVTTTAAATEFSEAAQFMASQPQNQAVVIQNISNELNNDVSGAAHFNYPGGGFIKNMAELLNSFGIMIPQLIAYNNAVGILSVVKVNASSCGLNWFSDEIYPYEGETPDEYQQRLNNIVKPQLASYYNGIMEKLGRATN